MNQLIAELHDLRREVESLRAAGTGHQRLPVNRHAPTVAFVGAALAIVAAWSFVPAISAQGASISGCVVPNTHYLRIGQTCVGGEKPVSILSGDTAPGAPKSPPPAPLHTNKVRAPFEVVDEQGRTLMLVTSAAQGGTRGIKLFNDQRQQIAVMNAIGDGGLIKVIKAGTDIEGVSMSTIEGPQMTLREGGKERAILGRTKGGRIAFWVNSSQGVQLAALGESPIAGGGGALRILGTGGKPLVSLDSPPEGGAVHVFTGDGRFRPAASMLVENGKGVIGVFGASGNAATALTESDLFSGAGRLYVNDAGGGWAFAAGLTNTGGNACVNRKTGLWCVGVNIPMGIGASPK
jgi:hypothetical protein